MPGKARPGKSRNSSSAKKRFKRTGKGVFAHERPAHNHLLQQKSKRSKRMAGKTLLLNPTYRKMIQRAIPS